MHTMSLILDDLVHPQHLLQDPDFTLNITWLNILQTSNKWYQTDIGDHPENKQYPKWIDQV